MRRGWALLACLLLGAVGEGGPRNAPTMVGWWVLAQGVKRWGGEAGGWNKNWAGA